MNTLVFLRKRLILQPFTVASWLALVLPQYLSLMCTDTFYNTPMILNLPCQPILPACAPTLDMGWVAVGKVLWPQGPFRTSCIFVSIYTNSQFPHILFLLTTRLCRWFLWVCAHFIFLNHYLSDFSYCLQYKILKD